MKRRTAVLTFVLAGAVSVAFASGLNHWRAALRGLEEVPSVSTVATGKFNAEISRDEMSVNWELTYEDLEGTVTQAHIHFADRDVNGGISVWLCSNLASPPTPMGVQACPPPPATISGTFTSTDVVGPAGQGIAPGQLAELIAAIRARHTYANVHSTMFPGGEARGQIVPGRGRPHDH
ncbi:MAG: CHRD domain-containing protein [Vicinamibacterales bacterium]